MIKVGQKVFLSRTLNFKSRGIVFPKGTILVVTESMLPTVLKCPDWFPPVFHTFPNYPSTPKEKAKGLFEEFNRSTASAAHYANKRQDAAEEFSAPWQYWRLVSILLYRKHCGVAFRDVRKKPRMKNKTKKT